MTLIEFEKQSEHAIVRNNVLFNFYKIHDLFWLIEVSVRTFQKKTKNGIYDDFINAQTTITGVEAYYAYNNLLDGGLE